MKQRELVWIEFPFSNQAETKTRPGLIVSNDRYNVSNQDVVICAITSKIQERPYSVAISQKDLSEGVLPLLSMVKADKIMQVEKKLIIQPFAEIDLKTFEKVAVQIQELVKQK